LIKWKKVPHQALLPTTSPLRSLTSGTKGSTRYFHSKTLSTAKRRRISRFSNARYLRLKETRGNSGEKRKENATKS